MADDDKGAKPDDGGKPDDDNTKLKTALDAERKRAQDAENQLKALRVEMAKLKKDDDASKTEMQRLTERIEAAEKKAVEAEGRQLRAEVIASKRLTPAMAKRLQGTTREELEADADELLRDFKAVDGDGAGKGSGTAGDGAGKGTGDGTGDGARQLPASGRPKEKLTSGAVPATTSEKSPAELAESILKAEF